MTCPRRHALGLVGLLALSIPGCAPPAEGPSLRASPASPAARIPPPPAGVPGDVTLVGRVVTFPEASATDAGLCLTVMDPSDRALDGDATVVATATTAAGGNFSIAGLPVPPSVGWILVVDDCGDTSTWFPTGTLLPGERVGGRGSEDAIPSVDAYLLPTRERDRIDEGLAASGSTSFLGEGGGMIGRSFDSAGAPNHESWVRGPNATQLWYPQADGTFTLYDHTDSAAGGLYVAPDAEDVYGVFLTRSAGLHFQPVMAGGLPGVVQIVDFVSEDADVAGAG